MTIFLAVSSPESKKRTMIKQTSFKAVAKVPAYKLVEQSIRQMVMSGELSPGELLPPETELAEQLEVTRPTVREAFRSLEGAGLIKRGPRRRMLVTAPSPLIVQNAMHEALVLHGVSLREVWELHSAIEPLAAGLAASKISENLLAEIEDNLSRTSKYLDKPAKLVECDIEFHELIAKAADNQAMQLTREPLSELLFPAYGIFVRNIEPGQRLLEAHTKIFQALKKGNEKLANSCMVKHMEDFRSDCELAGLNFDKAVTVD